MIDPSILTRSQNIPESKHWADTYIGQVEDEITKMRKHIKKSEDIQIIVPIDSGYTIAPNWFGYRNPNLVIVKGFDHNNNSATAFIPLSRFTVLFSIIKKNSNKKKIYGFQKDNSHQNTKGDI